MFNNYYEYPYANLATRTIAPQALSPFTRNITPLATQSISPLATTAGAATKTFTWSGLLNGASKTLGVINQAIPIFYQVKPIINNAKTMFRVVKEINKPETNTNENINTNNQQSNNTNINNINTNNQPNFFV